jgi:hypothetical protein
MTARTRTGAAVRPLPMQSALLASPHNAVVRLLAAQMLLSTRAPVTGDSQPGTEMRGDKSSPLRRSCRAPQQSSTVATEGAAAVQPPAALSCAAGTYPRRVVQSLCTKAVKCPPGAYSVRACTSSRCSAAFAHLAPVAASVGSQGRKSNSVHGPPQLSSSTVIVCSASCRGYLQHAASYTGRQASCRPY